MRRHRSIALLAAGVAAAAPAGCAEPAGEGETPSRPGPVEASPRSAGKEERMPPGRGAVVGRVLKRTVLRAEPGGRIVARLRPRTEFGSARVLLVAARRGDWLGVVATQRPNRRLGWVKRDVVRLARVPWSIGVDISRRRLVLRRGGRVVERMTVAVGRRDAPTPTGRFAVTDKLELPGGSAYGCCAVALSGHQPKVIQGWTGGDRLAIHGTSHPETIGKAASLGCMRARRADLRYLLKVLPLGTPVRIRA